MPTPDLASESIAEPDRSPVSRRDSSTTAIFFLCALIAGIVAVALAGLSATEALTRLGVTDPGEITTYGAPFLRAAGEITAVIAVGSLLLAAFLVPPQKSGVLDVGGYRAVRMGSTASAIWAAIALVMVPMELSVASGMPITEAMRPANALDGIAQVNKSGAWLAVAIIAIIVAVASRLVLRWGWVSFLLALSIVSILPLAITGHAAAGGGHDYGVNSLAFHLVGASLWAGGLFAVLAHARWRGAHMDVAIRRYSNVATVSFIVVALSGVINALVRLPLSALFTTTYGLLVVGKIAALLVLGVVGYLQRQKSVRALQDDPTARGPLIRLASVEAIVFAATFGLAVALGAAPTPTPEQGARIPSDTAIALGYDLNGPVTLANLMFEWRFDLIFGTAAIVLAVVYLLAVRRLRQRGDAWKMGRTVAWILGCVALLVTTSSGVGKYMTAMFSVHMGAHMALSMLVPVLFVLGTPITLALRALKPAGKNGIPGPREWLLIGLQSKFSKFITHPVVAATLFVGGFYGLYLGGIYNIIVPMHTGHVLMNVHFLLSGYLFYWIVLGLDPAPRKLQPVARLGIVMATLPLHAFFGIALMMTDTVMGLEFYNRLALPWVPDLLADQKTGGGITWAAGELPLLLIMTALAVQWYRADDREAKQHDRRALRDHDEELVAHNRMFQELARRDAEEAALAQQQQEQKIRQQQQRLMEQQAKKK